MASHATVSPREAADRLAIRELVDAYAHCADRRDAKGQMALFTDDTIRCLDEFARQDGSWLFAERRLMVNWIETRPIAT